MLTKEIKLQTAVVWFFYSSCSSIQKKHFLYWSQMQTDEYILCIWPSPPLRSCGQLLYDPWGPDPSHHQYIRNTGLISIQRACFNRILNVHSVARSHRTNNKFRSSSLVFTAKCSPKKCDLMDWWRNWWEAKSLSGNVRLRGTKGCFRESGFALQLVSSRPGAAVASVSCSPLCFSLSSAVFSCPLSENV